MKIGMEIIGDREVIAAMDRVSARLRDRLKTVLAERATDLADRSKAVPRSQNVPGDEVRVTYDSDSLGVTIAPVPASISPNQECAKFLETAEKAVTDEFGRNEK